MFIAAKYEEMYAPEIGKCRIFFIIFTKISFSFCNDEINYRPRLNNACWLVPTEIQINSTIMNFSNVPKFHLFFFWIFQETLFTSLIALTPNRKFVRWKWRSWQLWDLIWDVHCHCIFFAETQKPGMSMLLLTPLLNMSWNWLWSIMIWLIGSLPNWQLPPSLCHCTSWIGTISLLKNFGLLPWWVCLCFKNFWPRNRYDRGHSIN